MKNKFNSLLACKKRLDINASTQSILRHLDISLNQVDEWKLSFYRNKRNENDNNFTLLRSFFAWGDSKNYQKVDNFIKSGMVKS